MARTYNRPPGVTVIETTQTGINPIIATPDQICLVGPSVGQMDITELITLSGTTPVKLKGINSDDVMTATSIISIQDIDSVVAQASNPAYTSNSGYIPGSYTFDYNNHTIARKSSVTSLALKSAITASDTSFTAETEGSNQPFPSTGTVRIGNEQIIYSSIAVTNPTTLTFTVKERGANGTKAVEHDPINSETVDYGFVIPNNRPVYVKYSYTPKNYFQPYVSRSNEFSTIEKRFGPAFGDDGTTVVSPLTLAAKIAIENGADSLVLQPLFYSEDDIKGNMPNRQQPTNQQSINSSTWAKSFRSLQNQENIGAIIPVVGQNYAYAHGSDGVDKAIELNDETQISIFNTLHQHIAWMDSEYDQLLIGIIGEDSTRPSTGISASTKVDGSNEDVGDITVISTSGFPNSGTIQIEDEKIYYTGKTGTSFLNCIRGIDGTDPNTHADAENVIFISASYASRSTLTNHLNNLQAYNSNSKSYNENLVFIAQTYFERPSTKSATTNVKLGGQYAAAAVAGKLSSYSPQISLTRKTIAGFKSLQDNRTKQQKTEDSKNGFFVIEQNQIDGTLVVRHSLTIDTTSVAKSELNAVRAKYYMIDSLQKTIDSQVIGTVIADETAPLTIATTVGGALRILQQDGVIVQFDSVQSQIDSIDPTQIGISFNYRPAFAINYVNIRFAIDLSNGVTSVTATDQANIGA